MSDQYVALNTSTMPTRQTVLTTDSYGIHIKQVCDYTSTSRMLERWEQYCNNCVRSHSHGFSLHISALMT